MRTPPTTTRASPTDTSPADRLRAGDHAALDALIDRHYAACLRAAQRFTGRDRSFAEDATQDAFLRFVRRPPMLTDDEHAARWLHAAVRSACIDLLRADARRRRREQAAADEGTGAGPGHGRQAYLRPAADLLDGATLDHLRQEVARLSADERDLLAQRFARGHATARLARDLGINRETLRGRLTRTLARLSIAIGSKP